MSLFRSRVVCESVDFFSHHIKPSEGDGVLTLANGANKKYEFVVPATSDSLNINSNGKNALSIAPAGDVHIKGNLTVDGSFPQVKLNFTSDNGSGIVIKDTTSIDNTVNISTKFKPGNLISLDPDSTDDGIIINSSAISDISASTGVQMSRSEDNTVTLSAPVDISAGNGIQVSRTGADNSFLISALPVPTGVLSINDISGAVSITSSTLTVTNSANSVSVDFNVSPNDAWLKFKGNFDINATYNVGDMVRGYPNNIQNAESGYYYICTQQGTTNQPLPNPMASNSYWTYYNQAICSFWDFSQGNPNFYFNYRGRWTPTNQYYFGDVVRWYTTNDVDGVLYVCVNAAGSLNNAIPTPFGENGYWRQFSMLIANNYDPTNGVKAHLRYTGSYNAASTYVLGDVVQTISGDLYIFSTDAAASGNAPPNPDYWKLFVPSATGVSTTAFDDVASIKAELDNLHSILQSYLT